MLAARRALCRVCEDEIARRARSGKGGGRMKNAPLHQSPPHITLPTLHPQISAFFPAFQAAPLPTAEERSERSEPYSAPVPSKPVSARLSPPPVATMPTTYKIEYAT